MSRRSLLSLIGIGLLAGGALVGCASGAGSSADPESTADATASAAPSEIRAGWLDAGRGIALVTYGSSSCVPVAAGEAVLDGQTLTVTLVEPSDGVCTRDMAPRATFVALPADVDPTADLTVTVSGVATGTATLRGLATAPAPTDEFAPSAGWVGDGQAAILTWGSSSCRPQVEAVTSDADVTDVTFAQPPADQVCTMDMAPRITLADLAAIVPEGDVSLTLTGGGVSTDAPIPVIGAR